MIQYANLRRAISWTLAALFLCGQAPLQAADSQSQAEPQPVLRIDDPFAAPLWRIDVDGVGEYLVSGSADKGVALWSLEDARVEDYFRVPIRPEERQRAHPAAFSPDGELIAYGVTPLRDERGYPLPNRARIYIIDSLNGDVEHSIDGIPTRAQDLRFSPDGEYLAAALSDGCGLRVWHTSDWSLFTSDDADHGGHDIPGDQACTETPPEQRDALPDTLSVLFPQSGDPWLLTSGATGVRSYRKTYDGAELILHRWPEEIGLEIPDGIALSPDGRRLAVAERRLRGRGEIVKLRIAVLDPETLMPDGDQLQLGEADIKFGFIGYLDPSQNKNVDQFEVNRVAWGRIEEEEWLFGGGSLQCGIANDSKVPPKGWEHGKLEFCLLAWRTDGDGAGELRFLPVGTDTVMDLAFLPEREALVYATQKRLAVVDAKGVFEVTGTGDELLIRSRAADLRYRHVETGGGEKRLLDFLVSDDAKQVYIEDYRSREAAPIRLLFDLSATKNKVLMRNDAPEGVHPPEQSSPQVQPLGEWVNSPVPPTLYGLPSPLPVTDNDRYRNVVLDKPRKRAMLVSSNFVRVLDYSGSGGRLLCERRVASEALRVNVTPDGKTLVTGHGDGTLRWFRVEEAPGGEGCRLSHLLSVRLSEVRGDREKWTWVAWNPTSGEYARGLGADQTLSLQLTDASCGGKSIKFGEMTHELYDDEAIVRALDRPGETQAQRAMRRAVAAGRCADVQIAVSAPKGKTRITNEKLRLELDIDGLGPWPQPLTVKLGNERMLGKRVNSATYAATEPVPVGGPGRLVLDLVLPPDARRQRGADFHLCVNLGPRRHCHPLTWGGDEPQPEKRRLWAVLVGISKYIVPANETDKRSQRRKSKLDLAYAQNDVLDLAKIFIRDYKHRVESQDSAGAGAAGVNPDYDEIRIYLMVSPTYKSDAAKELEELANLNLPYVRILKPGKEGLLDALTEIADESGRGIAADDLLLLHFSGHGLANPGADKDKGNKGHSLFLMPVAEARSLGDLVPDALRSDELIERVTQIGTRKLLLFDACRDVADDPGARPFDPAKMEDEFMTQLASADVFFSAGAGQKSREVGAKSKIPGLQETEFYGARKKKHQGNGLFTYVLLKALRDPEADDPRASKQKGKLLTREIADYVDEFFITRIPENVDQEPYYMPSRSRRQTIVRSLEPAAPKDMVSEQE